ncbi:MAG: hypothetical protein KC636_23035 [Myxococcales bacterium]|nr:hypothetical protein [Myxococcales bacterium]
MPRSLLLALLFACAPGNHSDADRVRQPAPEAAPPVAAARLPAPTEPAAPAQEAAAAQAPEAPTPGRSKIVDRHIVDPEAHSGFVEFAAQLPRGGALWIGELAGNGGRDVLIYIPPESDPAADVQLVYHFHGTYSEVFEPKRDGVPKKRWVGWDRLQQTLDAVTELQSKRPYNVALVYPLSAGKRPEPEQTGWWNGAYDRMWMEPRPPTYTDSFVLLHEEVVALLTGTLGVDPARIEAKVIAEGHSAGGIALWNIAESGAANVGEYIFLDASFEGWADGCYAGAQRTKAPALVTLVVTDRGIADPYGARDPWCTTREQHAALFTQHRAFCAEHPEAKPPGCEVGCEQLEFSSESWDERKDWCVALRDDMKKLRGVYLHRTKIPHAAQPRHFVGGLELPASRFE